LSVDVYICFLLSIRRVSTFTSRCCASHIPKKKRTQWPYRGVDGSTEGALGKFKTCIFPGIWASPPPYGPWFSCRYAAHRWPCGVLHHVRPGHSGRCCWRLGGWLLSSHRVNGFNRAFKWVGVGRGWHFGVGGRTPPQGFRQECCDCSRGQSHAPRPSSDARDGAALCVSASHGSV